MTNHIHRLKTEDEDTIVSWEDWYENNYGEMCR